MALRFQALRDLQGIVHHVVRGSDSPWACSAEGKGPRVSNPSWDNGVMLIDGLVTSGSLSVACRALVSPREAVVTEKEEAHANKS